MAKEEHEMPQSESDVESESGEENRESDKSDNESEYDDDDDDDDGEHEKLSCNNCGKEIVHIVYLMKCPRCSWKDFHWGKDAQR
jgi:DNA-directed RNA polymerase subunit RPC12/RpoP